LVAIPLEERILILNTDRPALLPTGREHSHYTATPETIGLPNPVNGTLFRSTAISAPTEKASTDSSAPSAVRSSPIRVLVVDSHEVVRMGLRLLLENHPGFQVVGEAANRSDALASAAREQPHVIVLGLKVGAANATDFLPELFAAAATARVLIFTGVHDPALHRRAVSLGAAGIVLKEQTTAVLLRALEKVHAGEVWLERAMIANVLGEMTR
jgi:ActR/RegA family two-component response regulator